ncbi:DNA-(apurinic or apyrimidinic site) lyase 2 [Astathelohania contejeani]|uniref:DNA-(Apurinic or apyrimidinic site) lyase 2 n=1 Tax=Astathelohania contejeani TaxID=164912 RepID=A0ABQ7HWY3_9MICR|nr:DNA-(apurinic or apyrimidinic site) lyase 2 [Thelohania contejeani]
MRILSFNVNGIKSYIKFVSKKYSLSFNDFIKNILNTDILCLQETKCNTMEQFNNLKDYEMFYSSNKFRKGYCGVATFVSKSLYCKACIKNFKQADSKYNINFCDLEKKEYISKMFDEGRIIITDHGKFKLLNCYFPYLDNNSADFDSKKERIYKFYELITMLIDENTILCGDLNAVYSIYDHFIYAKEAFRIVSNLRKSSFSKADKYTEEFPVLERIEKCEYSPTELPFIFKSIAELKKYFFESQQRVWLKYFLDRNTHMDSFRIYNDNFNCYTCWNTFLGLRLYNLGTRIDYVIIPKCLNQYIYDAGIMPDIYGSDHCPVYADFNISFDKIEEESNILKRKTNLHLFFNKLK